MNLKFYVLLFLFTGIITSQSMAQCLIPHSTLDHRIQTADLIVEGSIINKTAFWGKDINIIFTKYEVDIYKVFRGNTSLTTIHFIEQGGQLEDEMTKVVPAFNNEIGATGIFMLTALDHRNILDASETQYQPYDAHASMISYNPFNHTAFDAFEGEIASKAKLYEKIQRNTNQIAILKELPVVTPTSLTMMPAVTNINPTTAAAGVGNEITITGTGFGNTAGAVAFDDPDDGAFGSFITAAPVNAADWTNTSITIEVPPGAGTGRIGIITSDSLQSPLSPQTLTVPFNITNIGSPAAIAKMVDDACEDNGGYRLSYSTNTANGGLNFLTASNTSGDASTSFERAARTWQSQGGYALYAGTGCANTTVQSPGNDGLNVVGFANNTVNLGGAIGRAYSQYSSCNGSPFELSGIDIFFAQLNNWYYGENPGSIISTQSDFESVAVHEIGHTHQLGHIIDDGAVMHFSITNGTTQRNLNASSDIAGANLVASQSTSYTPLSCSGNCSYTTYNAAEDCSMLIPTPVELSAFTAIAQTKTTLLTWETINELNNDYFKIEHSLDGINYTALTEIRGAGTTQDRSGYRFIHNSPTPGDNYYRLSQTDFDATHEVLGVRLVRFNPDDIQADIRPNPVRLDHLQMEYISPENAMIQTTIYSASGIIAQQQTMSIDQGINNLTIPVHQLPNGVYFIQTIQNETVKTVRFIKSN